MTESAALGITARSSDPPGFVAGRQRGRAGRYGRWALQRLAARLLHQPALPQQHQHRTVTCGRHRTAGTVQVRVNGRSGRGHFGGVETCRNVWACPCCNGVITESRREELQRAVTTWVQDGGEVYLMTLTFPHVATDELRTLMKLMRRALQLFKSRKTYRRVMGQAGHVGSIRAIECTWGDWHGWHPHVHTLVFANRGQIDKLRELGGAWADALLSAQLADRAQLNDLLAHAFDLQNGDYAAEYVAKFGSEPTVQSQVTAGESWGVAREMVKGMSKTGKRLRGVTPFTLLLMYRDGDARAGELFREFVRTFKGERQLYWSPRLRKVLGMGKLFTDEEMAELQDKKPEVKTVIELDGRAWSLVIAHEKRDAVLRAVEEGGADAVLSLLRSLLHAPPAFSVAFTAASDDVPPAHVLIPRADGSLLTVRV